MNDGEILANGGDTGRRIASAGSGGAIWIQLTGGAFSGTGRIEARGGTSDVGYCGGGGRIAIVGFATNTFNGTFGDQGTLYLPGVPSVFRGEAGTMLSWGPSFAAYQLEATTELSPMGVWTAVTNVPVLTGGQYTVTIETSEARRFFRLKKP